MDLDGPRKSESMSMDVDDGAVSSRYPPGRDSVEKVPAGPSGGWMPSYLPLHGHPFSGRECPPGLDGAPPFMTLSSSSPVNCVEGAGEICRSYGLARQHRDVLSGLKASEPEITQRKRKRTDDAPHPHITEGVFTNCVHSLLQRRVRPRLRARQDGEFSPLLIMSPARERDSPVEDTNSAFHYPASVTDPSRSILRHFDPGSPQHSPSHRLGDLERRRSDSANSLSEVALASTVTPRHGRLSTLQDFWLPLPFEDTEQRSLAATHERGLDAGPLFGLTRSGRTGSPSGSREPEGSAVSAIPASEPSSTQFFDKPMCDSPDSIDPDEDGSNGPRSNSPGDRW